MQNIYVARTGRAVMILAAVLLMAGCTTTRKVVDSLSFADHFKKRAAVLPLINRSFIPDADAHRMFQDRFVDTAVRACTDSYFFGPNDTGYPAGLKHLPKHEVSGTLDNLALADMGRRLGLNTIVIISLVSVDAKEREKGLLFKDIHYFENVEVSVIAFSTETGAKLMDEGLSHEVEIDGVEFDAVKARDINGMGELCDALENLAEDAARKLCSVLEPQPWRAYVASVTGGEVVLFSGRETGMRPGDTLDVYGSGDVITGRYGEKFIIPGPKVGEIRISEVYVGKAVAAPLVDNGIKPGCTVRPH